MNAAYFIARRYLFSKKKKNFINIISIIAVVGVAVGTAALIIVLSVFNGLRELTVGLYTAYHPQIQITPAEDKSFEVTDSLRAVLRGIAGVAAVTEVIEDNALLRYDDVQMAVNVKGVSENFAQQYDMGSKLVGGEFALWRDSVPQALMGIGVQAQLSIDLEDDMVAMVFWYPRKRAKVNLTDPSQSFNREPIMPGGVLAIEQQFDNNLVLVPLAWANQLMGYGTRRTSLEISTTGPDQVASVQATLQARLGPAYLVRNSNEQQASILRAVELEKLFAYITLSFIVAVASFNIFFSLTMLVIEKQHDIAVLFAMGAGRRLIRRIFLAEGLLIAVGGTVIGLVVGFAAVFLQAQFGLVGLGTQSHVVQSYPVKLVGLDFVYVSITVLAITFLSMLLPARNAAKVELAGTL
ncbi:MAG: FtsX-like permease family protein [Bernardetiaceae bacterium]|jgi:lipoprotein-releasing system permease protein|nr:FtsX-like permease family protein [Bernardetiaceae bacterium]